MFRSTKRAVVIPQSEHARLSGALARIWGNEQFDRPALDFDAFVTGVIFHDRGYPEFDDDEIGVVEELRWLDLQKQTAEQEFQDPVVDLVVKYHVKRLLGYRPTPERTAYASVLEQLIDKKVKQHNLSSNTFERADCVTHFCDNVSFDFCFEEPREGSVAVFAKNDTNTESEIHYRVDGQGGIYVDPWPFSVPSFAGFIVGYHATGYPEQREPCSLCYLVKPMP